ncbi:MAG: 50S ribosomal protein L22 [Sedimentisphaerales bacterium]|nr:50S ribosomal protein L22 [Sedimentisphaerales bacterium]
MLSGKKLSRCRKARGLSTADLAERIERSGLSSRQARAAIGNWEQDRLTPAPTRADIDTLAQVLQVPRQDLVVWSASHRYAPIAPRKARLIAQLIRGRTVQDALDLLKFANKRSAVMVDKVLRSAIANADEQEADVERLYVSDARVDEGGVRLNTRRWRPKDRGRAVSWTRLASHIHVSVDMD